MLHEESRKAGTLKSSVQTRREFIVTAASAGVSMLPSAVCAAEGKEVVSFGMVADIHYADIPDAIGRSYREGPAKLSEAVEAFNRAKPDFIVELGDFKDFSGDRERTLACLDEIERVFSGFRGDRFHVMGNHDFDCLSPDEFLSRISNSGQKKALARYSFVRNGVTFVVLDACYDSAMRHYSGSNPWEDANIPPDEMRWFAGELERAAGAVVVFCHQRLDPGADALHLVKNAAAVRSLMEKSGKVKAVFTGHEHSGGSHFLNGIAYYTLRAMVTGRGPDENSYAVASLFADGSVRVKGWKKGRSV